MCDIRWIQFFHMMSEYPSSTLHPLLLLSVVSLSLSMTALLPCDYRHLRAGGLIVAEAK